MYILNVHANEILECTSSQLRQRRAIDMPWSHSADTVSERLACDILHTYFQHHLHYYYVSHGARRTKRVSKQLEYTLKYTE